MGSPGGFAVKLNFEIQLSCPVGASSADPVEVWARAGVGTRWPVAMEDAKRNVQQPGNFSRHLEPTRQQSLYCISRQGFVLIGNVIQQAPMLLLVV